MGCGQSSSSKNNVYDHTIDLGDIQVEHDDHSDSNGDLFEVTEGAIVLSSASKHKIETVPVTVQKDAELQHDAAAAAAVPSKKPRKAVFARGFSSKAKEKGSMARSKVPKTLEEEERLVDVLSGCYLFSDMSQRDLNELVSYMWKEKAKPGSSIITQGKKSDLLYVIHQGTFEISSSSGKTVKSGCGDQPFFNENSLLFPAKSTATVKCVSSTNQDDTETKSPKHAQLWAIDRTTFRTLVTSQVIKDREDFSNAVSTIPLLQEFLTPEQQSLIAEAMEIISVKANQRIVSKGEHGDVCYFIQEGTVVCSNIGKDGAGKLELGAGSYFGERALLTDEPRAADVDSKTDTILLAVNRKDFIELLGPLRSLMDDTMKQRVMDSIPILQQLPSKLRGKIVNKFELNYFNDGEVVVKEGEVGDRFYIVRSGVVDVLSAEFGENDLSSMNVKSRKSAKKIEYGSLIASLKEGEFFGEMSLLHNEPRAATCVARGEVECFSLSYDAFKLLRNKSEVLVRTSTKRAEENRIKRLSQSSVDYSALTLKDISRKKILGKGTFGTVYLCETSSKSPVKNGVFALKTMSKAHIVQCDQTRNVVNEKLILEEMDHPFIVKLYTTFQDKNNLFMLLEFVQGGELFSLMQLHYRLPLAHAQFYTACVAEVFYFIHSLEIVYRDLKPENLLVDRFGYVKLADFGFAKHVVGKTYTLCGTPEYLAPELVLGKGHDRACDNWALGVLLYEMLVGMSCFADEYTDDQIVVCKNIVNGRVNYRRLEQAIEETEISPPSTLSEAAINYVFQPNITNVTAKKERKNSSTSLVSSRRPSLNNGRPCEHLIRKLLAKNPAQRLGSKDPNDIKRHIFFNMSDDAWTDLKQRKIPPPFKPKISNPTDTSAFDEFEEDKERDSYTGAQDWCASF